MARHKTFVPGTFIPGSRIHRDKEGKLILHDDPSKPELFGKPIVTSPKPAFVGMHFANHAARLRIAAAAGCSPTDDDALRDAIKDHAKPRDMVRVSYLRGFQARFANEIRADLRRAERLKAAA